MRTVAVVLACLVCTGQARKVQVTQDRSDGDVVPASESLVSLLQALNPSAAFQGSGAVPGQAPARATGPAMAERFKSPPSKYTYAERMRNRERSILEGGDKKWKPRTPFEAGKGYIFFQRSYESDLQPDMPSFFSFEPPSPKAKNIWPITLGLFAFSLSGLGFIVYLANLDPLDPRTIADFLPFGDVIKSIDNAEKDELFKGYAAAAAAAAAKK